MPRSKILLRKNSKDTPKEKFNKDFDDFMGGLEPLDSEPIQINLEFLDPNDDREFINYLNNLETPNEFDNLEEWSDDIDLFMESLLNLTRSRNSGTSQRPKNYGMIPDPTSNISSSVPRNLLLTATIA